MLSNGVRSSIQILVTIFTTADLHTVSERLKSGYYSCCRLFIADMLRIFRNCRTYNEKSSDYYKYANAVERFFINKMKEVGAMVDMT